MLATPSNLSSRLIAFPWCAILRLASNFPRPACCITARPDRRAQPGMFFTIEPMVNAGKFPVKLLDSWTAVTRDRSLRPSSLLATLQKFSPCHTGTQTSLSAGPAQNANANPPQPAVGQDAGGHHINRCDRLARPADLGRRPRRQPRPSAKTCRTPAKTMCSAPDWRSKGIDQDRKSRKTAQPPLGNDR